MRLSLGTGTVRYVSLWGFVTIVAAAIYKVVIQARLDVNLPIYSMEINYKFLRLSAGLNINPHRIQDPVYACDQGTVPSNVSHSNRNEVYLTVAVVPRLRVTLEIESWR